MLSKLSQKRLYQIILCLVLLLFVLVNACAALLAQKFDITADMTEEKLYRFSDVTTQIAQSITQETNIYVISAQADYPSMLNEVLSRYAKLSPQINVAYIDPYENPMFLDHYKQMGFTLAQMDLLVEGAQRAKQIAYEDILTYSDGEVTGINIEQQVSGALLYVGSTTNPQAVFTTGHNERGSASLEKLFADNNFVTEQTPLTGEGDIAADVVVISSPTKDFEAAQTAKLERYLEQGGSLMVFLEPGVNTFTNLSALLEKWNLGVTNNVIFEDKAYVLNNPLNLIPMYTNHPINSYFADNQYYVVMPSARGVEVLDTALSSLDTKPVLISTTDAYAKAELQYNSTKRAPGDEAGPFVLAAASQSKVAGGGKVFLAGSRSVYADDIMGAQSYANTAFLAQTLNYLWDGGVSISIPAKTIVSPPLAVNFSQSVLIAIVLVIILPLCVAVVGIGVYRKRKHL